MRHHPRLVIIGVLSAGTLLLAACGGSDPDPAESAQIATLATPAQATSDEQAAGVDITVAPEPGDESEPAAQALTFEDAQLEFSQCMRDSGYPEWPDPDPAAAGGQRGFGGGVDLAALGIDRADPDFRETTQTCRAVFDGVAGGRQDLDPEQQAELEDTIIELFACLRENPEYEDLPDPDFANGGGIRESLGAIFQSGDFNPQDLFGDLTQCREDLGIEGFGGPGGAGPGGRPGGPRPGAGTTGDAEA